MDLPRRYSVYAPLVLYVTLPAEQLEFLRSEQGQQLLKEALESNKYGKGLTHVAANAPVPKGDIVRRPHIEPLYGFDSDEDLWVTATQNGIVQTWAPMHTMFSRGNIKEKARVLQLPDITANTVIDLYGGIGYFVFSYAKNRPKHVFCWDLNPWSVEALVRGARLNKFRVRAVAATEDYVYDEEDFIVVFCEDNQKATQRLAGLSLAISHINMGLLPHCRKAWPLALDLASQSSIQPQLHIHENVAEADIAEWAKHTGQELAMECEHVEKIKTFAPGVWHVCGDFRKG